MKKFALIVAGGTGSRMKGDIPKQFLELAGLPVLMHTFECFRKYDAEVEFILVLPKTQVELWKELCVRHKFQINYRLAEGGKSRFHSVKNGLNLIRENGIVFIHDGVRPLVSAETITNCFVAATENGNALPVIPVNESIRCSDKNGNKAVNRQNYSLVQTPQTFRIDLIKKAYQQEFSEKFTDDASVLEEFGQKINLVEGNRENIKITYPEDLVVAKSFLIPQ